MNFGLNTGRMTQYGLYKTSEGDRIFKMVFKIGDKELWYTHKLAVEDAKGKEDLKKQLRHPIDAIVGKAKVDKALEEAPKSFREYVGVLKELLDDEAWQETDLDIWVEYQYHIREGQDRTWLQLPRKVNQGWWCVRHVDGAWKLQVDKRAKDNDYKAMQYVDGNKVHPLAKSGWYMRSNYANKQTSDEAPQVETYDDQLARVDEEMDSLPF